MNGLKLAVLVWMRKHYERAFYGENDCGVYFYKLSGETIF